MAPLTLILCLLASDRPDLDARYKTLAYDGKGIALAGDVLTALEACEKDRDAWKARCEELTAQINGRWELWHNAMRLFPLFATGPEIPIPAGEEWRAVLDLNHDGRVDQQDFGLLQRM